VGARRAQSQRVDPTLLAFILQLSSRPLMPRLLGRLLTFLGILIVESYASAGLGMAVGSLVPSVDAGLAIAPVRRAGRPWASLMGL
jgi:hypothetical protein